MKSNNIISYLKLVICILSAIVSAGLMACSNIHNNGSKSSSNDLKPLIIGSDNYVPYSYLDSDGNTGICFFHSIDAHLMPEFIGQGRVDHDQLKIRFRHAPPGFGPAGNDHRAAVAHFGQPCSDILVGACTGTYDQCTSHFLRSFLLHTLFCRGQMALK